LIRYPALFWIANSTPVADGGLETFIEPEEMSTSTQQMTRFELCESVVHLNTAGRTRFSTHETTDSNAVFAREYKIATLSLAPSVAFISVNTPLYSPLNLDPIKTFSQNFAFCRWKALKVRVLVISNPLMYGDIFVNYLPFMSAASISGYYTTVPAVGGSNYMKYSSYSIINYNPIVLNITPQQECVLEIPWNLPTQWATCGSYETTYPPTQVFGQNHGSIHFNCPNPINATDTTALTSCQLDVFVSFVGLEFGGPRDPAYGTNPTNEYPDVEAQMQPLSDLASGFAKGAGTWAFNKASDYVSNFDYDSAFQYGYEQVIGSGGSKPDTVAEPQNRELKFEPFNDSATLGSFPPTKSLSDTVESDALHRCGDPFKKHSLKYLITRPFLVDNGAMSNAGDESSNITLHPRFPYGAPPSAATYSSWLVHGYMPYFAQFFRFARGSIKLYIIFTTSPFVSARVRLQCYFGKSSTSGVPLDTFSPAVPTQLITIKGTTTCSFTIPFCFLFDWIDLAAGTTYTPHFNFFLDNGVQSSGNRTASIQYLMFMAAGDDFQFRDFCTPGFQSIPSLLEDKTPRPQPRQKYVPKLRPDPYGLAEMGTSSDDYPDTEAQMKMWEEFDKPFPPMPGMKGSDTPLTLVPEIVMVEDMLTRWSTTTENYVSIGTSCVDVTAANGRADYPRVRDTLQDLGTNRTSLFDQICNLYYFNTGSVLLKGTLPPNYTLTAEPLTIGRIPVDQTGGVLYSPSVDWPETGLVSFDPSQWHQVDFSVPWIANVPWDTWLPNKAVTTKYYTNCQAFARSGAWTCETLWKRAGPNFELALLAPLPDVQFWPGSIFSFTHVLDLVHSPINLRPPPLPLWRRPQKSLPDVRHRQVDSERKKNPKVDHGRATRMYLDSSLAAAQAKFKQ